jgi:signal transduction histidine kinase/ActR/RegA family two-component response regulator
MRTILLADDEPGLRALAGATLGPSYRILEAVDGAAAFTITQDERPDLVLLDVQMPKLDGLTVCRRIKADPRTKGTVVLMLSGFQSAADQTLAFAAGADGYLSKPFSPSALLAAVERGLQNPLESLLPTQSDVGVGPTVDEPRELDQMIIYARELRSLYSSAQSQAARFRQLVEISRDLTGAVNVEAVLGVARARVASISSYNRVEVFLAREIDANLELWSVENGGRAPPSGEDFPDPRVAESAARDRRPISALSLPTDGLTEVSSVGKANRRTVYLPLVTPGGRVVGVLALAGEEPNHPGDDLDALLLVAGQLAAAIESAQLNERLQRSVDALLAIHEAGNLLGSKLAFEEVGRHVLDIATRVAGFAAGLIGLRNEAGELHVWQTVGDVDLLEVVLASAEVKVSRYTALAMGNPQTFHVAPQGVYGWSLPLRVSDRVIGVLEVFALSVERDKRLDVLVSLANQAASGLENARLYRELADRERRLQELVRRLLAAQEEERRRVAYDVHDGLAQSAAAAHRHLQAFAHHYRPRSAVARQQLDQAVNAASRTVGEARQIIANLRPTVLDDFGLATAIRLEVDSLRSDGWEVAFDEALGPERLPSTFETALYRVAQEAITNVRKHAGATRAYVSLRRRGATVYLEVQDWGRGFTPVPTAGTEGPGERVGLASMRERVGLLGGQLSVESGVGAGARIVARIPWPNEDPGGLGDDGRDVAAGGEPSCPSGHR